MTPLVVGGLADVAGFMLAGADGVRCTTREDVEAAITPDRLLIFSPAAAALVADRIAAWQRSGQGPLFVVLED
jgi:vacuolar-type H+-ATPase subunit F/Vma7